jgi:hypothetical protein
MIRHQPAAGTDDASGDGMIGISSHFDNFSIFNVQQQAAARMAKTAITSFDFSHFTPPGFPFQTDSAPPHGVTADPKPAEMRVAD